jgi:hypothetical protein
MLKGNHDPLFAFTRFARRSLITIMKTDNVGYLGFFKCGARLSHLSVVFSYDEATPTWNSELVL